MNKKWLLILMILLAGCTLAPKYERPEAPVPKEWPAGPSYREEKQAPQASQLPWRDFITDERLREVIAAALANNRDLRAAGLNVEKAKAMFGISRATLLPTVNATGSWYQNRVPADLSPSGKAYTADQYSVNLGLAAWEIDFFGRIRSLKDAALEQYLATDEANRSAQILLVATVTQAYLALAADREALQLVSSESIPTGLAVLDAPDIDSVEERNRHLAGQLLGAADLWLFVTSAARYADQVPWDFLKQASERSVAVAIVLDRTPPKAIDEVSTHLARMLSARGLKDSPLFVVPEGTVDDEGLLPTSSVEEIRTWLTELGADSDARNAVVRQTLEGAIRSLSGKTHELADHAQVQVDTRNRLWRELDDAYAKAISRISDGTADGTLLRGEVLNRWQEFVGAGELLKTLESRVSWLRDRITKAVKGQPVQARQVEVAVESGLLTLVSEHMEAAAEATESEWRATAAGKQLLDESGQDLSRASREFRGQAERMTRDWQQGVIDLVRTEGADKRTSARFLAYGVNGLAVALMIVSFASTGGLVGAEIGIAGGSAIIAQKLLEAVFGDQAVRRLAQTAHKDLINRIQVLADGERARFQRLLDDGGVDPALVDQLRELARRVDDLRFADRSGQ